MSVGVYKNGTIQKISGAPVDIETFKGATDTEIGVEGLVPASAISEKNYFLRGDGTWAKVEGGGGDSTDCVKYDDILTLEEIEASTDLDNKVASAEAVKDVNDIISSGLAGEIYSDEETVIGTWKEKPLYRRVMITTSPSKVKTWDVIYNFPFHRIKNYRAVCVGITNNFNDLTNYMLYSTEGDGKISMIVSYSSWLTQTVELVVEYTKTTD